MLSGMGKLPLAGGGTATADPKQHVDLPDNILDGLTNATFEAWVSWPTPGNNWTRIFDFGSGGTSTSSYVFLTPKWGNTATNGCRAAFTTAGSAGEIVAGGAQATGAQVMAGDHHFVVIIDDANDTFSLYLDGNLGASVGFTGVISGINDVNNWLGRSQYAADYYFAGTFDEFRIYNVALTVGQLRTSRTIGPNAAFF
jgi:hypothetical protein